MKKTQKQAKPARLNACIRREHHIALKVRAATEGTTISGLIDAWVSAWVPGRLNNQN